MTADKFLEAYGGQTTDELLALTQAYRIDSLVLAFEQAIQGKPANLVSREERYVLAIEGLEREVNNGGYAQFFTNSSGEFAADIEAALQAINCPKTAAISGDAVRALGIRGMLTADAVAAAVDGDDGSISEKLAACDDRYFGNDEPIADRLFAWIGANKAKIRVGGA